MDIGVFDREYSVTPGKVVKVITGFIVSMFAFMLIVTPMIVYLIEVESFIAFYLFILLGVIIIPTILGAWAYSPNKYILSSHSIKIIRPISAITIPLKDIQKVEPRDINTLNTVRLWANGGLFSMSGLFYNKEDGKFWVHAKNNNYIMIHGNNKKYVISPDERDVFLLDITSKLYKLRMDKDLF